jgi:hypothetical protein
MVTIRFLMILDRTCMQQAQRAERLGDYIIFSAS